MIQWVVEQVRKVDQIDRVLVATDDDRIATVVKGFGAEVFLTRPDHPTGTDRLAEVTEKLTDAELILNVQGDEPLISPIALRALIASMDGQPELPVATLVTPLAESEADNPNVVKAVASLDGYALYFSRSRIPYSRNPVEGAVRVTFQHIGVYLYRRDFLLRYASLPPTPVERAESLEQLRVLEHGYRIRLVETAWRSLGVDTSEDLERVRKRMGNLQEGLGHG